MDGIMRDMSICGFFNATIDLLHIIHWRINFIKTKQNENTLETCMVLLYHTIAIPTYEYSLLLFKMDKDFVKRKLNNSLLLSFRLHNKIKFSGSFGIKRRVKERTKE